MAPTAKIGIIGAGISGLATAHYLIQQSLEQNLELEVTTLERSDRLGALFGVRKLRIFC
jgi:glycine/D-amino acid oxidase-like deaminating enzyme